MRRILLTAAFGIAVALTSLPAGATAGTPADDLGWLNAKRAANGIPGDIALRGDWSEACARHVAYMRETGSIAHAEDPASRFFTASGDWAARNAVLASAPPWTEADFIWERAPLHLAQLMAPQLAEMGIADDDQLVCATTIPGFTRADPPTPQTASYPGNGGVIYAAEVAEELPTTPAATLGIAQPTGPNLLVYRWGGADPDPGVRAVQLDGPTGRVRVRWVDRDHPTLGPYLPPGGAIIVPVAPLQPDAVYSGLVQFDDGGVHAWAFTTRTSPPATEIRRSSLTARRTGTLRVCVRRGPLGCARFARRDRVAIELRGRIVNLRLGQAPVAGADVDVRGSSTVRRVRTGPDGSFAARFTLVVRPDRRVVGVTASVPGDAARAWPVRITRPA